MYLIYTYLFMYLRYTYLFMYLIYTYLFMYLRYTYWFMYLIYTYWLMYLIYTYWLIGRFFCLCVYVFMYLLSLHDAWLPWPLCILLERTLKYSASFIVGDGDSGKFVNLEIDRHGIFEGAWPVCSPSTLVLQVSFQMVLRSRCFAPQVEVSGRRAHQLWGGERLQFEAVTNGHWPCKARSARPDQLQAKSSLQGRVSKLWVSSQGQL